MNRLACPRSIGWKVPSRLLQLHLVLVLAGCSSSPPPNLEEIRGLEAKRIYAGYDDVMKESLHILQDLGFTVENTDASVGIITARRQTTVQLGELVEEPSPKEDDGLPTWAKVLIIVTGVIIIVGIIALIAGSDDDDNTEKSRNKGKNHDHETNYTTTYVETESSREEGVEYHNYRLTVNLERLSGTATGVRISLQGSRMKEDAMLETGAVYSPQFYRDFFARLEQALPPPPPGN